MRLTYRETQTSTLSNQTHTRELAIRLRETDHHRQGEKKVEYQDTLDQGDKPEKDLSRLQLGDS